MKRWTYIDYLILFIFSFVVTVTIFTFIYPPTVRLDSSIYFFATKLAFFHLPLYPLLYAGAPFTYPPSIFLFFLPLLVLPSAFATSLWNFLSVVAVISSILLILKLTKFSLKNPLVLLLLSITLLLEPVRETLLFGQNNSIVLFFIILSYFLSKKESSSSGLWSGVALGIAASLKVFPLFLLFYFLIKKDWVTVFTTIVVFIFFLLAGTFGQFNYLFYYLKFAGVVITPNIASNSDQSLYSLIMLYLPFLKNFQPYVSITIYFTFLSICYINWRESKLDFVFFTEILAGTVLLITPLAWVHHLVFLIPLSLVLFLKSLKSRKIKNIACSLGFFVVIFINGQDVILLLQKAGLPIFSLLYFHALLGLGFLILWQFVAKYRIFHTIPIDKGKKGVLN